MRSPMVADILAGDHDRGRAHGEVGESVRAGASFGGPDNWRGLPGGPHRIRCGGVAC